IAVGSANMTGTGKDIVIMRLNPDLSLYTTSGYWQTMNPIILDGQGDEDVAYAVEETNDGATNYLIITGKETTNHIGGIKSENAWVGKMYLNGYWAPGWTNGKEYGGTSRDVGYDIKEDRNGNYVIAGTATIGNNDVPTNPQGDGDYWVFKVDPTTGYLNPIYSKVYFGGAASQGNDYAHSLAIDCYNGNYVVSGFCKSCDPQNNQNSQTLLVKIKPDFSVGATPQDYGNIDATKKWDYGSFYIFQTHDGTFNYCAGSDDGFLSVGLQHPPFGGCWGGTHDFWALKTHSDLTENTAFIYQCVNADIGGSYGGRKNDKGFSAALTCGGYLLAGITQSDKLVQTGCPTCEVSCNHYGVYPDLITEDIWLIKIDGTTNQIVWNESESIGKILSGSDGSNEGAYSLKRIYDGSYILAGYTGVNGVLGSKDFFIVKFELTEACAAPTGLQVNSIGTYCASVSWTNQPCVWKYKVESQEDGAGAWVTVADPAPNPCYITDNTSAGLGNLSWRVTAYCSSSKYATTTAGTTFSVSYCNGCTCPSRLGSDVSEYNNKLLSVYPNPSGGTFNIKLSIPDKNSPSATIDILDQAGKVISTLQSKTEDGLLEQQLSFNN
ncbi:MAG: T9SS type A sorting domain-containing protein, partial [Chitinophagales bacterium]|nr:T9SS type A sorting domain-containing protein [Chitinophagales bacterium]